MDPESYFAIERSKVLFHLQVTLLASKLVFQVAQLLGLLSLVS